MAGPRTRPVYHCGMCSTQFPSRAELDAHTVNHTEVSAATLTCPVCPWRFEDALALENHQIINGHGAPSSAVQQASTSAPVHDAISCDRCAETFRTQQEYNRHRSFRNNGPCADHNHRSPPRNRVGYGDAAMTPPLSNKLQQISVPYKLEEAAGHSDSPPSDYSEREWWTWCPDCNNRFTSMAQQSNHVLRCSTMNTRPGPSAVRTTADSQAALSAGNSHSASNGQSRAHPAQAPVPTPHITAPAASTAPQTSAPRPSPSPSIVETRPSPSTSAAAPRPSQTPSVTAPASASSFACDFSGCQMSFGSEAGLRVHKSDRHGVGGPRLDITGRDSWMMNQRERERMRAEGLLPPPAGPSGTRGRGGGGQRGRGAPHNALPVRHPTPVGPSSTRGHGNSGQRGHGTSHTARPPPPQSPRIMARAQHHATPPPIPAFGTPPRSSVPFQPSPAHMPVQHTPARNPTVLPNVREPGGALELQQAKYLEGVILSLLIQSDILIHNNGKITVCGIDWTRIGVERQLALVAMFEDMCHLPKHIQHEYLPHPKTFLTDYQLPYPSSDFEPSPPCDSSKPGLGIVALACSKIALANGLDEVVKISAIDVMSGRILMNHLVCTDPTAKVKDWRSSHTGLFSWNDLEQARKLNYKVFKGWTAARTALWKYIDKETIVVGHNLRSDLDALRMIHGRAVDVAKVAEKAAKGPLSKPQLGLDSMCRDFPAIALKSDPEYGRDVLMNAFAIREMALHVIKNTEPFERKIRQKSLDYQRVMQPAAAVA